jgi:hypothetical protein
MAARVVRNNEAKGPGIDGKMPWFAIRSLPFRAGLSMILFALDVRCSSVHNAGMRSLLLISILLMGVTSASAVAAVLDTDTLKPLVDSFTREDDGKIPTTISNVAAWPWMIANVPMFDCPQQQIQEVYYFRWWSYRKHIRQTPGGYVITEFLPDVPWAKKYNTISCAAGHHLYEGRWIRDAEYLDQYTRFWFHGGGSPRQYSFWVANAAYARFLVNGDKKFLVDLLPDLVANYQGWERTNYSPDIGLFHQIDTLDGMEISIGGSGYRPTLNSYMYGDAIAIAKIAELADKREIDRIYRAKAASLKSTMQAKLWNPQAGFFEVSPDGKKLADVREQIGFVPWYFDLPDPGYESAWKQVMDPTGLFAPFGPTTAERRSPRFMFSSPHDCLWNGPSWPYATSQTLTAAANLLNDYHENVLSVNDYLTLVTNYAKSQYKDGHPWIAEDLDGITEKWIVDKPRSVYYNHSTYCDLIITGLVGLRPRADDVVEVNPLIPADAWDYFCLDNVPYHGRNLTILYDRTGERYHRGRGLRILANGKEIAASETIQRLTVPLPK